MIKKTSELRRLHNLAFYITKNNLLPGTKAYDNNAYYSDLEWENYVKWGYRYIGNAFLPHITLGKITSYSDFLGQNNFDSVFADFSSLCKYFTVAAVAAYKMGEFGNYLETLALASCLK